ncbi:N-acetyl-gamma-glutamyl-phosphate reductase [Parvularcula sp. ZS-1/3]|uniref:N-acetyl-gamma-glutamyl-phosphate reductase n=1 Tax=Parvularcula mediterranea TaxID=2732508 RepID=A0A7Y3W3I1_9PROT|nr:N-acetyl-gamma-glutamyl-phosphate reductase [Parvularcula mediterranea]NNU14780.1 N-acetyl-gamma-glutamyl-phosphate reductase [Parvularcula mediterranea]
MIRVGLIGARGYVGRELIAALDEDSDVELVFASSRAMAGKRLSAMPQLAGLTRFGALEAEELGPEEAAAREADAVILGLPNGLAKPYVDAIGRRNPECCIVDLSADYRHQEGWVYGAPELNETTIRNARRIANPGCYATAANLALLPLRGLTEGPVQVFGVSGFSGAGTTPGPRNDPERLEANIIPYGFGGHGHEGEIAGATGLEVVFAPHVGGFFRGLMVTVMARLSAPATGEAMRKRFEGFYRDAPLVSVGSDLPDLKDAAGQDGCLIGGFALSHGGRQLTFSSALDNLRKGAATQAMENLRLAFGFGENG